jgi:transcriptional regulator with XRE-family HTH domain
MPKNRIRELRKQKGISAEALAERIGLSRVQVTRIESGARGLSIPHAEAIAVALDATVENVLGLNTGSLPHAAGGLSEEVEEYDAGDHALLIPRRRLNVSQMRAKQSRLDQLDILDGDILTIDFGADAVERAREQAKTATVPVIVIAILFADQQAAGGTTILRQLVPPNLLITNSRNRNDRILNVDVDDVHIRGVVIAKHRELGYRSS